MDNLCRLCLKMSSKLEDLWNAYNGMEISNLVVNICGIKLEKYETNKPRVSKFYANKNVA